MVRERTISEKIVFNFGYLGETNIEVVNEGTPEASAAIKSGVVRVILGGDKNVKYPPLRQS